MMTTGQILWGLNSFLFIVCFFFVKMWIASLGKTIDKIEIALPLKVDGATCLERKKGIEVDCSNMAKHKHAPVAENGTGGEVILP